MSWFRRLWNRLCAWLARHGLLPRAGIFYIGGSDSLPPPLSREVEAEMLARLDEGDFEVRQILIEHNLRLVAYIARRFDMVTELGKALDPVADKLIQAAMMLCAAARTPLVWLLLAAHILRETLMAAAGLYMLRVLGQVYGAQWYGKVCTALIYAVMIALLLFPDMPEPLAAGGVFTCVFMVLMCLVMYLADYARVLRGEKR